MRNIVLLSLVALAAADIEFYKTANDHLDMDALIADKAVLQGFMDCFLDRVPCSEALASYKRILPESVRETCRRCNPNQRYQYWRFLEGLKVQLPEEYMNFRHRFDPKNIYMDKLEKEVSKYVRPDMDLLD